MNTKSLNIVVLGLLLVFSIFGASVQKDHEELDDARHIEQLLRKWDSKNLPGFSIAVIKNGEVIFNRGYGMADLEHEVPFTNESVSLIGSVSKQFLAAAIYILEQEGKIHLGDPIHTYLPKVPAYAREVTVDHLIHHTSGISDYVNLIFLIGLNPFEHSVPPKKIWELIDQQDGLMFEPGSQYNYSNSNYFLLAEIVEHVTGTSVDVFVEKNIFAPLQMDHTTYLNDKRKMISNRAMGYQTFPDGSFGNTFLNEEVIAGGGIFSTTGDLVKWVHNFDKNKLGNGDQNLIDIMLTRGTLNDGSEINYGGGLFIGSYKGTKSISHTGLEGSYRSRLTIYPEKKTAVIVLYNTTIMNPDVTSIIDGVLFGKWPGDSSNAMTVSEQFSEIKSTKTTVYSHDEVQGRYKLRPGVFLEVKNTDDFLTLSRPAGTEPLIEVDQMHFKGLYSRIDYEFSISRDTIRVGLVQHFPMMKMPPIYKMVEEDHSQEVSKEYDGKFYSPTLRNTPYYVEDQGDGKIMLWVDNLNFSNLYKEKEDTFLGDGIKITFHRNADGVTGFELENHRIRSLSFKKAE